MKIRDIIITTSAMLLSMIAEAQSPINDLSHLNTETFSVEVITDRAHDERNSSDPIAIFFLDHPHTNTLKCEVTLSVPVVSEYGNERVIMVTMPEVLIFPTAAFPDSKMHYDINISGHMKDGEKIKPGYHRVQKNAALCSGLSPNYRLSRRTCLALNENHEQFCKENARHGGERYGLNINDQFIGICSCN